MVWQKGYQPKVTWKKGQSGNPSGRPKSYHEMQALAREFAPEAIHKLVAIMRGTTKVPQRDGNKQIKRDKDGNILWEEGAAGPEMQFEAAVHLLDRGLGKPAQAVTGQDGGPLQVDSIERIVVHVIEPPMKTIEHE
jgi:hypothetical protein